MLKDFEWKSSVTRLPSWMCREKYLNLLLDLETSTQQCNCATGQRVTDRLQVVSNFGDGDCGAGEIHTRARAKFRGDATRGERLLAV